MPQNACHGASAVRTMKHTRLLVAGVVAAAVASGLWWRSVRQGPAGEQRVDVLDPARIQVIRTPGGFLQVSELRKVEEFAWQSSWECPIVDCSVLPKTTSRVRVQAHYSYRIPLAAEWRLEPDGSQYRLIVPPVRLQEPVAFDTTTMELVTTEKSVLSPAVGPNRERVLRHLGPELAQRGASLPYLDAQHRFAEQTVREFARKWMLEQGKKIDRPIRVVFNGPNPL